MRDEERLSELLSVWQQHLLRGHDKPAEELARDCPALAPELARRIALLRQLEAQTDTFQQTLPPEPSTSPSELNTLPPEPSATPSELNTLPPTPEGSAPRSDA